VGDPDTDPLVTRQVVMYASPIVSRPGTWEANGLAATDISDKVASRMIEGHHPGGGSGSDA
jgi:hypothetical protein